MTQALAGVRTQPPTDIELAAIVRNFHTARVLVVGDIILDRYISGAVQRLSPEAPIPVLRPASNRCTLGGAANVALNIATLGGQAVLVGVIGADAAGRGDRSPGRRDAGYRAGAGAKSRRGRRPRKTRFMTGSHQLLRLDEEVTDATGRGGAGGGDAGGRGASGRGRRGCPVGLCQGRAVRRCAGGDPGAGAGERAAGDRRSEAAGFLGVSRCHGADAE